MDVVEVTYINLVVSECLIYSFYPILSVVSLIVASIFKASIDIYQEYTEVNLNVVPAVVISAGSVGAFFIFMIVCMSKEVHKKLVCFVVFPLLLTLQITALVYGCVQIADHRNYLKHSVEIKMSTLFLQYYDDTKIAAQFNTIQQQLECCGVISHNDYKNANQLPISCCPLEKVSSNYCVNVTNVYKDGCASKVFSEITLNIGTLSYITIGLVVLQIFVGAYIVNVIRKFIQRRNSEYTSM